MRFGVVQAKLRPASDYVIGQECFPLMFLVAQDCIELQKTCEGIYNRASSLLLTNNSTRARQELDIVII